MSRDHRYFVYIVECADGLYYTGVTNNLDRRIQEHNEGVDPKSFTFKPRPVKLRYWLEFSDIRQAIEWKKQLKGWGRKKKEALFNEDWGRIKLLAKSKQSNHRSTSRYFGIRVTVLPGSG
jgi:putative endonuclease